MGAFTPVEAERLGKSMNGSGYQLVQREIQMLDELINQTPLNDHKVELITHRQMLRECGEAYQRNHHRTRAFLRRYLFHPFSQLARPHNTQLVR